MMLDAAASLVMIGNVGKLGSMSTPFGGEGKPAMVWRNQPRFNRTKTLGVMCVAVAALLAWHASTNDVEAGLIVSCNVPSAGDASAAAVPNAPPVLPFLRYRPSQWFLLCSSNSTDGAGASAPLYGSTAGLVAAMGQTFPLVRPSLISRLSLGSRISLPDPFAGRFFRPPRPASALG